MRIEIERRGDRYLGMLAGGKQQRCVAVPQIMKPHPRQILDAAEKARELVGQTLRLQRLAVAAHGVVANSRFGVILRAV